MIIIMLFFLIFLVFQVEVYAVLDGRTGNFPIELDTTYSFSNFEWARGYVKFRNGFDVPINGTIILGINQEIEGPINLNSGTIILERDIILNENVTIPQFSSSIPNFFKTNNHTIFVRGDLYLSSRPYIFSDSIIFDGMKTGRLFAQNLYAIRALTNNTITIKNIFFFGDRRTFAFLDINNGPPTLNLENVSLGGINEDFSFFNISGNCTFIFFYNIYQVPSLRVKKGSSLLIQPLCKLYCNEIILENDSSLLFNNAELISTFTPPLSIEGSGKVFIQGQSSFKADGDTITVDPNVDLVFKGGARLTIEKKDPLNQSGAHLIIN